MSIIIWVIIIKYIFAEYIAVKTHVINYINPKIIMYDFLLNPNILQLSDKNPYNGFKIKLIEIIVVYKFICYGFRWKCYFNKI